MTRTTFLLITPFFLWRSHCVGHLSHELSHGFVAWLLGYKASPFDIHWGKLDWKNLLLQLHVDQGVDIAAIYALGHPYHVTLIQMAGMTMNLIMFGVCCWWVRRAAAQGRPFLCYFMLLWGVMNLGNFYDYVPIRTFRTQGHSLDILDIEQSLGISPWWVWAICFYPLAIMTWRFFTRVMLVAYSCLGPDVVVRAVAMTACTLVMFGYFALPGYLYSNDDVSPVLAVTSWLAIPGLLYLMWPTRAWVREEQPLS